MVEDLTRWRCESETIGYDFLQASYVPPSPPIGKLQSVTVLLASVGADERQPWEDLCMRLQAGLGLGRTVWGVTHDDAGVSWELYFYRMSQGREGEVTYPDVVSVLPEFAWESRLIDHPNVAMFSVELRAEGDHRLALSSPVNIYPVASSIRRGSVLAYVSTDEGQRLKNVYINFNNDREALRCRLSESLFVRAESEIDWLLAEGVQSAADVYWVNKPSSDGLYFSQVDSEHAIAFVGRHRISDSVLEFMQEHQSELDHLKWDLGFDFLRHNGELRVVKSGIYGVI